MDFASGSVPALIPFLTDRFDLGYALAALLLLAATISSSLVQPLFGLWSDRSGALWLIPGGTAIAAIGVGAAAVSPVYPLVVLLVFAGGLGVAAFHPEGAKFAAYASGAKRASGMSYFNIGGNLGYALGAFVTGLWCPLGLVGGLLAMIPVLVGAVALMRVLPRLSRLDRRAHPLARGPEDQRGAMALLGCVIALRASPGSRCSPSSRSGSPHTAIPRRRGTASSSSCSSPARSARPLGPVADAIGLRRTLVLTQLAIAPLVLVFVYVGGPLGVAALMASASASSAPSA